MKTAMISKDNSVTLKIGFTKQELEKILAGEAKEMQFDQFHHVKYLVLIKCIKDK